MNSGQPASRKRFSDFAEDDRPLTGKKVKIETILNREILVTGCRVTDSKFRQSNSPRCLMVQFRLDDKEQVFFTGSGVLISQLEKYGQEIPFWATVQKIERYFTLT